MRAAAQDRCHSLVACLFDTPKRRIFSRCFWSTGAGTPTISSTTKVKASRDSHLTVNRVGIKLGDRIQQAVSWRFLRAIFASWQRRCRSLRSLSATHTSRGPSRRGTPRRISTSRHDPMRANFLHRCRGKSIRHPAFVLPDQQRPICPSNRWHPLTRQPRGCVSSLPLRLLGSVKHIVPDSSINASAGCRVP